MSIAEAIERFGPLLLTLIGLAYGFYKLNPERKKLISETRLAEKEGDRAEGEEAQSFTESAQRALDMTRLAYSEQIDKLRQYVASLETQLRETNEKLGVMWSSNEALSRLYKETLDRCDDLQVHSEKLMRENACLREQNSVLQDVMRQRIEAVEAELNQVRVNNKELETELGRYKTANSREANYVERNGS